MQFQARDPPQQITVNSDIIWNKIFRVERHYHPWVNPKTRTWCTESYMLISISSQFRHFIKIWVSGFIIGLWEMSIGPWSHSNTFKFSINSCQHPWVSHTCQDTQKLLEKQETPPIWDAEMERQPGTSLPLPNYQSASCATENVWTCFGTAGNGTNFEIKNPLWGFTYRHMKKPIFSITLFFQIHNWPYLATVELWEHHWKLFLLSKKVYLLCLEHTLLCN